MFYLQILLSDNEKLQKESSIMLIETDLPRTFPELKVTQPLLVLSFNLVISSFFWQFLHSKDDPNAIALEQILCAYTIFRPDVGYVQVCYFHSSEIFR